MLGTAYFFLGGLPLRWTVLSHVKALSKAFFLPPLEASPKNAVKRGRVPLGVGRYPNRQNQPKVRVDAWSMREMPGTFEAERPRAAVLVLRDRVEVRRVAMPMVRCG